VSRAPGLLGALVAAAAAVSMIAACSVGSSEGTVVAKNQNVDDYACHAGGAVSFPAAVPVLSACAGPTCWQLVVRDSDGTVSRSCVSREEYDHTPVGAFWHGRTDR
jgi:hypothetical protein